LETEPKEPLQLIASYESRDQADEHALVVMAMQLPCWIFEPSEEAPRIQLAVLPQHAQRALSEIDLYEKECAEADARPNRELPNFSAGKWYALAYAALLLLCYGYQFSHPEIVEQFRVDNRRIVEDGEKYRAATALLLHGDIFHVCGNMLYGVVFGLLIGMSIGPRTGWVLVALSGFCGNLINSYHFYVLEQFHRSIGASTATFGGLGILAGFGLIAAFLSPQTAPWARAILPTAGGLAMLAWTGFGDGSGRIDVMAHVFGFAVGVVFGFVAGWVRILSAQPQVDSAEPAILE